jgi:hypothetical protein
VNVGHLLVCEKCGELLFDPQESTAIFHNDPLLFKLRRANAQPGSPVAESLVQLHIRGVIERLLFEDGTQLVMGRANPNLMGTPDRFDLNKYGARERGVSRAHALLRFSDMLLTILDLGSLNGTFLNNRRLPANEPHVVRHNDEVSLGRLGLRVQFETPSGTGKLRAYRVSKTGPLESEPPSVPDEGDSFHTEKTNTNGGEAHTS